MQTSHILCTSFIKLESLFAPSFVVLRQSRHFLTRFDLVNPVMFGLWYGPLFAILEKKILEQENNIIIIWSTIRALFCFGDAFKLQRFLELLQYQMYCCTNLGVTKYKDEFL